MIANVICEIPTLEPGEIKILFSDGSKIEDKIDPRDPFGHGGMGYSWDYTSAITGIRHVIRNCISICYRNPKPLPYRTPDEIETDRINRERNEPNT